MKEKYLNFTKRGAIEMEKKILSPTDIQDIFDVDNESARQFIEDVNEYVRQKHGYVTMKDRVLTKHLYRALGLRY